VNSLERTRTLRSNSTSRWIIWRFNKRGYHRRGI